jgi:hypothetical protein
MREHQVKDEQIVGIGVDMAFAFAAVACEVDGESFGAQPASDEFRQFAIVFDNEYAHREYLRPAFHSVLIRAPLEHH